MSMTRGPRAKGKRKRGTPPKLHLRTPLRCATGKVTFRSRAAARKYVGGKAHAKDVYQCRECGNWHTTSSRPRKPR